MAQAIIPWVRSTLIFNIVIDFILFQRKEYVKYSKVFPLSEALDFKVPSKWYRRVVGGLEVVFGAALAAIPSRKFKIYVY